MCGIAGVLLRPGKLASESVVASMAATLRHRGPDRLGVLVDGPLGLAATRLAVVDPGPTADQPQRDDRYALAFNGEIYNHAHLRRRLESEGLAFHGRGDTEVLFRALVHWGVDETLPRLRGMFALAFADRHREEVWLARDRLGIKPLVWRQCALGVAWASEAKALRPVGPLSIDRFQAALAMSGGIDRSSTLTAFTAVEQVPPGHSVHLQAGDLLCSRAWWQLEDAVDEGLYRQLAAEPRRERTSRLDAALEASVETMSASEGPLGLFLSGGVDSSLLAAYACRHRGAELLTADVGGPRSERDAAEEAAAHLGRPLVVEHMPSDALLDDWSRSTWHLEAPLVTHLNGVAFGRLAGLASGRGIRAVLSGEGADELFFGYPEVAARPYLRLVGAPGAVVRRLTARLPRAVQRIVGGDRWGVPESLALAAGHRPEDRLRRRGETAFSFLPADEAARQAEVFPWLGAHLLSLLRRNDALGMASGVEARFPFLDEEVVRLGVNLSFGSKIEIDRRPGNPKHPFRRDKAALRRVAERRLPPSVAGRRKRGFPVYGHDRVRIEPSFWRGSYVVDLLRLPRGEAATLVDPSIPPYHLAKLASVEVFGRIFERDESVDEVTRHLREHVKVDA